MKLKADQLAAQLQKQPASIYWVSGDDPLLTQECCDTLRHYAKKQGMQREIYNAEPGFDWNSLLESSGNLSLFAESKLIELRLPKASLPDAGKKALQRYIEAGYEDNILLISSLKVEAKAQKTKWFQAIEKSATFIQIWPIEYRALPQWIGQRMQLAGFTADQEALQYLAARTEGNLLAAQQEIEKLSLLLKPGPIDLETLKQTSSNHSRYDAFELVDCCLQGDGQRALRILGSLKTEGTDCYRVLWALNNQLRKLAQIQENTAAGLPLNQALQKSGVWQSRQGLMQQGLKRLSAVKIRKILLLSGETDRIIKGVDAGNPWDNCRRIAMAMCISAKQTA